MLKIDHFRDMSVLCMHSAHVNPQRCSNKKGGSLKCLTPQKLDDRHHGADK